MNNQALTQKQISAIAIDAEFYFETGIELTSAIKQAATDHGIKSGNQMQMTVAAVLKLFGF